jgi:adenine-specific DNA-methyltransferase
MGIIASKLFWFYIAKNSTALRGNTYRLTPEYINPFPVHDIKDKKEALKHDNLVTLVDQMLSLKKREQSETVPQTRTMIGRQIAALDTQIDKAVYKLYGLTEDEIKVVEGEG